MKKFLLKLSVFVVYALLWHTVFPAFVDPYNVFHTQRIRANGVIPAMNYIRMKYVLKHPDRFDSFMFGSSRVGAIYTDRIIGERCYIMSSFDGIPEWYLGNIKTLLANNIHPRKIYVAVDYNGIRLKGGDKDYFSSHFECPYEYLVEHRLHFLKQYLDPAVTFQSLPAIIKMHLGRYENTTPVDSELFHRCGAFIYRNYPLKIDWNNKSKVKPATTARKPEGVKVALSIIGEIAQICRDKHIELVIFTHPLHYVTYLPQIHDKIYTEFLEGLAEITDFWNFGGLNDITLSNDYYIDTSHYKAEVGDLIVDIMCNGVEYPALQAQGFGVKVTRENVRDFTRMLKTQAEKYPLL